MKLIRLSLLAITLAFFTACGNYTEEFTLNADGSGSYTVYSDIVTGSIEMGAQMATMFAEEELTEAQMDSVKLVMADKIWEDFPGEIDSTIDMVSEMPDSFLNYGNNREYAERMVMYMRGSKEKGYMNIGAEIDFKDGDDYVAFSEYFENMQNSTGSGEGGNATMLGSLSDTKSDATYTFDKKSFKRTVKYTFVGGVESSDVQMAKMMEMMGENGKFRTIINTERKIKKAKGEYLMSQEDYKVVFEYPFMESIQGSINTDFEIIFE